MKWSSINWGNSKYLQESGNILRELNARVWRGMRSRPLFRVDKRFQRSEGMDVLIEVERTPNPKALKFIINQLVKSVGKLTLKAAEEAEPLPLARDLFGIMSVNQVHLFENVITVSHDGSGDWSTLVPLIEAVIQTRIVLHDTHWEPKSHIKAVDRSQLSPELQKIEEILDRTIRPGLRGDGGDIEVVTLQQNILTVAFQGACGGCPSSTMGTLNAIEGILQQEFDSLIRVVPQGMESPFGL